MIRPINLFRPRKSLIRSYKKNFWFLLIVFLSANLLVRSIDFFLYFHPLENKFYVGHSGLYSPWDTNVYLSAINSGQQGTILLDNPYDTLSTQPMLVYPFYTLLGTLGAFFHLSPVLLFHLTGIATSFLLLMVTWWFLSLFFTHNFDKKISLILLYLGGGGLTWLYLTNRLISAEKTNASFTYWGALKLPHEAISLSLLLICIGSVWQWSKSSQKRWLTTAISATILTGFFHPYNYLILATIFLSFEIYQQLNKKPHTFLWAFLLTVAITFGYLLLIGQSLINNPSFAGLKKQALTSPSPFSVALCWGVLFPFIAYSLTVSKKNLSFFKIWLFAQWLLIYLPFNFQCLLARGLWVPAVILAVKIIKLLSHKINFSYHAFISILVGFSLLSPLTNYFTKVVQINYDSSIFLQQDEMKIFQYLNSLGQDNQGVLAEKRIASFIPALTPQKSWAGHAYQTPNYEERHQATERFYAGKMEKSEAKEFLNQANLTWVYWGPEEKETAGLNQIPYQELLIPVIENETASLYRVK